MRTIQFVVLAFLVGCSQQETTTTETTTTTAATATTSAPPPVATTSTTTPTPAGPTCTPATDRLCPVDEAATDASFAEYRQQLRAVVTAKDKSKLLPLVDPGIRTSFGNGGGIKEFNPNWAELDKVLGLGGSFRGEGEGRSFWAPYVYANWPESLDPFEHVAATGPGVVVRAEASPDAAAVTTVSWSILKMLPGNAPPPREWLHVETPDRKQGWVRTADVHSPVGYRAGFSKRSGKWLMDAFIAGD